MFSEKKLVALLKSKKLDFIKDVRYRPSDNKYLIFVLRESIGNKASKEFTSYRQLNQLKNSLKRDHQVDSEVIIVENEDIEHIEARVVKLLIDKYRRNISTFFSTLFNKERYKDETHDVIFSTNHPSMMEILRMLKIKQPANKDEILGYLKMDYEQIDEKWLKNKLDLLRKKNHIIRDNHGKYVLSMNALISVPSGARRSSSDIERALDLGKRKW